MASVDVMIIKRGVNGIGSYFVQDLSICKNAIQVHCNKTPIIVIMHQYAYFGKGRSILSNLQIANQMDHDSNGYPPVLDGIYLDRDREHILCVLHLDEYCSKIPWIIQSHVPLEGEQFQGELTMILKQELSQVELPQADLLQVGLPQAELPQGELL